MTVELFKIRQDKTRRQVMHGLLGGLLVLSVLVQASPARGAGDATITVNSAADADVNDSECTLREAINAANTNAAYNGCAAGSGADVIVFAGLSGNTITLNSDLVIANEGLTIDGIGVAGLTVTRSGAGRLITVNSGLANTITLKNFTLSGGSVTTGGNSDSTRGGAVWSGAARLDIDRMRFVNNSASGDGGAIYAGSTIKVVNSTFEGNSATTEGGAIFASRNSFGVNQISGSTFDNNTAGFKGGAVFVKGSSNSAEQRTTFVNESTFTRNKVTQSVSARGGAINVNSPLHVTDSRFERNDSGTFCGGVNLENTDNAGNPAVVPVFVTSTQFISNAGQLGGGLCADGPLTISGSEFRHNNSIDSEGGAVTAKHLLTVSSSTFISNTSKSSGAAIAARYRANISHSTFFENYSLDGLGGGVFITSTVPGSTIINSLFVKNQAAGGSAIGVRSYTTTLDLGVRINHVTMFDNFRGGSGGVEVTQHGWVTVTNSIIGRSDVSIQRRPEFVPTAKVSEDYNLLYSPVDTNRHQGLSVGPNTLAFTRSQALPGPVFVSSTDFHLAPNSIALNEGGASSAALGGNIDFDNESRPSGSAPDIGYDEYSTAGAPSGLTLATSSPTRLGNLTAFSATLATGSNINFTWSFGDGSAPASTATVPNATRTYAAAGTYTVYVTATNSFGATSATAVVNVTNATPVANAGADLGVLNGAQVQLNGSASSDPDGHTPLTYQWTQTAGTPVTLSSANVVSPTFTAPATAGSLTFSLIAIDARGLASAADTVVVTVSNNPINGLTAINDSPTRIGAVTRLTATVASSAAPVTYQWYLGVPGATATGPNPSYTYPTVGTYTATVTATNGSDTKVTTTVITISNNPITGLSFPGPAPSVVISVPTVFTASVTGGGPVDYAWTLSGPQSGSGTGPTFTMNVMQTGNYQLTVVARNPVTGESRSFARTIVVSDRVVEQKQFKVLLPVSLK